MDLHSTIGELGINAYAYTQANPKALVPYEMPTHRKGQCQKPAA